MLGGRLPAAAGGVDGGRVDGPGGVPTFGVLAGREGVPGALDRGVALPELPDTVGVPGERELPAGVLVDRGVPPLELLDTRGLELPRSLPACRTRLAFDWSVVRAAWAVSLTFWPVDSVAAAARSAPALAVLMASSALTIATWPNTPALWADAPMLSLPPTPSRIWLPRPENRLLIDSTASGSMLEPWPGAMPGAREPPDGVGDDEDEPPLVDDPDEPPCLRVISQPDPGSRPAPPAPPAASRTA